MYYDKDADLSLIKSKTVAIIGFGSQGHAHAQNLRDSGVTVVVSELKGTPNGDRAEKAGFEVLTAAEATKQADVVMMLVPDQTQATVYKNDVGPNLKAGATLMCFGKTKGGRPLHPLYLPGDQPLGPLYGP